MLDALKAEAGLELDPRGNVKVSTEGVDAYLTSIPGVFGAGDMRRGQSLVVWAVREGWQCARAVDEWLMGGRICRDRSGGVPPPRDGQNGLWTAFFLALRMAYAKSRHSLRSQSHDRAKLDNTNAHC